MSRGSNKQPATLTGARLKTPRAAAVAGIIFSILLMTTLVLLRLSVPDNPLERGAWLGTDANRVTIALNLVPFAGVAFLWFIGVLRARLGDREDGFFATVFLGSGLLFLAMLFSAAAIAGAVIMAHGAHADALTESVTFTLARALSYGIMNVYAVKVAAVFMITASTLAIYTGIAAPWIAYLGYALALLPSFRRHLHRLDGWNVVLVGGLLTSIAAAAAGFLKQQANDPMRELLERLKSIADRAAPRQGPTRRTRSRKSSAASASTSRCWATSVAAATSNSRRCTSPSRMRNGSCKRCRPGHATSCDEGQRPLLNGIVRRAHTKLEPAGTSRGRQPEGWLPLKRKTT